jgi:hypothetical protein
MHWTRLRAFRTLPEAHLTLNELLHAGFAAEIRGETRAPLAGEIPFSDARLEVWVPTAQAEAAGELLAELDAAGEGDPRACPRCGEENPPAFELCWSCRAPL